MMMRTARNSNRQRVASRFATRLASREGVASRLAVRLASRSRSQAGASFAIALMFALAVAFIATAVIATASVAIEQTAPVNRADDQAYYAVTSGLAAASDLVKRDVCSTEVTVSGDKTATISTTGSGTDPLGLAAWARDQVQAIVEGGTAKPKNLVIQASGMGGADVPDVLVTLTMTDGGIYARACVNVWDAPAKVPASDAVLKADLVERADYADFLTKQVASSSSLTGGLPLTVTWDTTQGGA